MAFILKLKLCWLLLIIFGSQCSPTLTKYQPPAPEIDGTEYSTIMAVTVPPKTYPVISDKYISIDDKYGGMSYTISLLRQDVQSVEETLRLLSPTFWIKYNALSSTFDQWIRGEGILHVDFINGTTSVHINGTRVDDARLRPLVDPNGRFQLNGIPYNIYPEEVEVKLPFTVNLSPSSLKVNGKTAQISVIRQILDANSIWAFSPIPWLMYRIRNRYGTSITDQESYHKFVTERAEITADRDHNLISINLDQTERAKINTAAYPTTMDLGGERFQISDNLNCVRHRRLKLATANYWLAASPNCTGAKPTIKYRRGPLEFDADENEFRGKYLGDVQAAEEIYYHRNSGVIRLTGQFSARNSTDVERVELDIVEWTIYGPGTHSSGLNDGQIQWYSENGRTNITVQKDEDDGSYVTVVIDGWWNGTVSLNRSDLLDMLEHRHFHVGWEPDRINTIVEANGNTHAAVATAKFAHLNINDTVELHLECSEPIQWAIDDVDLIMDKPSSRNFFGTITRP